MFKKSAPFLIPNQQARNSGIRRHYSFLKTPRHEPQKYGGRIVHVKQSGTTEMGKGLMWKRSAALQNRALAVFEAQEFSRRHWKSRDYDVVELPYELAPAELQRVLPEPYTENLIRDARGTNLRRRVFTRDEVGAVVYGEGYRTPGSTISKLDADGNAQPLTACLAPASTKKMTLDKLLGDM
eukprot:PhM_4_TR4282/c0_g1_i1/m.93371